MKFLKYLPIFLIVIGAAITIITCLRCKNRYYKALPNTNYVELKATYTNYVLINKEVVEDSMYIFRVKNPQTKDKKFVKVNDYIYYNLYFIGDTIK